MTTLSVPLHMPMKLCEQFLKAELSEREVSSVKVLGGYMIVEYSRAVANDNTSHVEL